jgi:hypothetical protein
MEQNNESTEFLGKLAMIADASQSLIKGKITLVFELSQPEFRMAISKFPSETEEEKFKVEISGTDFIFILDK